MSKLAKIGMNDIEALKRQNKILSFQYVTQML